MARRSIRRRLSLGALVAVALALGLLQLRYPLPYVLLTLIDQGPDYADMHQFPARKIAAQTSPASALPIALDADASNLFAEHPRVSTLDTLLEETETTAFLVVHDGEVVVERYLRGDTHESLQNTFSVSKSLLSCALGLALAEGVIELAVPITEYLPELSERDARFAEITVEHLLDMRSGLSYSSEVAFPFVSSDSPLIYYHPDLESVALERTHIEEPPGSFLYNNYNPPLLGVALRRVTGVPVGEYVERELWQPLGAAQDAGWTVDSHGMERMESGFHARARDLARFGLLYLRGGAVGDTQVVPTAWVSATTTLPETPAIESYDGRRWWYRLGWWIVPRPSGPADFCAIGHFGQFIYVSPQYDAVFVRNGPGRGDWSDRDWTELFYFAAERL